MAPPGAESLLTPEQVTAFQNDGEQMRTCAHAGKQHICHGALDCKMRFVTCIVTCMTQTDAPQGTWCSTTLRQRTRWPS